MKRGTMRKLEKDQAFNQFVTHKIFDLLYIVFSIGYGLGKETENYVLDQHTLLFICLIWFLFLLFGNNWLRK